MLTVFIMVCDVYTQSKTIICEREFCYIKSELLDLIPAVCLGASEIFRIDLSNYYALREIIEQQIAINENNNSKRSS